METQKKVLILGAGPGGIGAALALKTDFLVLEKQQDLGGLSGTVEYEGAVFDLGGHSFHTPHPEVKEIVKNALPLFEQKRDARCFALRQMIPYPFQKNFRQLKNDEVVSDCVRGLDFVKHDEAPHYEAFIQNKFGPGISEHFMLPYNRKLWGRDLKRLSSNWTAERVASPEGVKEQFETTGGKRTPLQSDTEVAYPAKGGFGEIFKALGKNLGSSVEFGASAKSIDLKNKKVLTEDGRQFCFEKLVSTLPLPELLKITTEVPREIIRLVNQLEVLSLKVVLVVIDHPVDTEIQRVYSAEPHIAAHKTAVNHNSSDYLRSLPRHGIMAEVSYSAEKILPREDVDLWVVENLCEMSLIKSKAEVFKTKTIDVKYAYPVPTLDRNSIVQEIKSWLEERSLYTVGRFGEWAYINSDEVLYRGLLLGRRLAETL